MKATAKVSISMGLLTIPNVKMFTAVDSGEKVSFSQLHYDCKHKLEQKMYCPACDRLIVDKKSEIIKGYPQGKKKGEEDWVIMEQEEIDSCKCDSSDTLKIIQFVTSSEIPEIYFNKPNYLAPEEDSTGTFGLFYHLLTSMDRVALGKAILRQKDHFYAIKPTSIDGKIALVAYDLHFPAEIRSVGEVAVTDATDFDDDTIHLAKQLVEKMSKPFDPSAIKDEYTEALKNLITAKAEGKVVTIAEVKREQKSISLKDALAGSLKEAVNF